MIDVGLTAQVAHTTDGSSTAVAMGSGDVAVLATPKVVALVEEAAVAALASALGQGETSVGTAIDLEHLAPTPLGGSVTAMATVSWVDVRRIGFDVVVRDDAKVVARGSHTRVIVDRDRFLASAGVTAV
jgi:fluoroacetyl-CoA thioesterase